MAIQTSFGAGGVSSGNVDDILTRLNQQPAPSVPGKFRRFIGGLAGGALNMFMPGVGSAIGGLISGNGSGMSSIGEKVNQYQQLQQMQSEMDNSLQLQQQANSMQRNFELTTTILKLRQDCALSAIRNMKSS